MFVRPKHVLAHLAACRWPEFGGPLWDSAGARASKHAASLGSARLDLGGRASKVNEPARINSTLSSDGAVGVVFAAAFLESLWLACSGARARRLAGCDKGSCAARRDTTRTRSATQFESGIELS